VTPSQETLLHGEGFDGSGYTLCGFAEEGNPGEAGEDAPVLAKPRQTITCPKCQQLIAHVLRAFTSAYRVRS
jgi:hypothetical protein